MTRLMGLLAVLIFAWLPARAATPHLPDVLSDLDPARAAEVDRDLQRLEGEQIHDGLGHIHIPRVGLSAPILEGVDDVTIRRAVGHFPETPPLTAEGNVALAAHRTTHFRPLRDVVIGDIVTVTSGDVAIDYVIEETLVVQPEDVWVLRHLPGRFLTLVTCYPFDYVGTAPQRLVVRARAAEDPRRSDT